jgi:hypothetical protein
MHDRPAIKTAIPKGRWQLGDYGATLLGEIESGDGRSYRWILAFVRQGQREPGLYVCAERPPPGEGAPGDLVLRAVCESFCETLDRDPRWADRETFADQALKVGAQALGLQRERQVRLM